MEDAMSIIQPPPCPGAEQISFNRADVWALPEPRFIHQNLLDQMADLLAEWIEVYKKRGRIEGAYLQELGVPSRLVRFDGTVLNPVFEGDSIVDGTFVLYEVEMRPDAQGDFYAYSVGPGSSSDHMGACVWNMGNYFSVNRRSDSLIHGVKNISLLKALTSHRKRKLLMRTEFGWLDLLTYPWIRDRLIGPHRYDQWKGYLVDMGLATLLDPTMSYDEMHAMLPSKKAVIKPLWGARSHGVKIIPAIGDAVVDDLFSLQRGEVFPYILRNGPHIVQEHAAPINQGMGDLGYIIRLMWGVDEANRYRTSSGETIPYRPIGGALVGTEHPVVHGHAPNIVIVDARVGDTTDRIVSHRPITRGW